MPAKSVGVCLLEYPGIVGQLRQNATPLSAQLLRLMPKFSDQSPYRLQTFGGRVPLGRRKASKQLLVPRTFLDQQRHGVLISGEELNERSHTEAQRQSLQGILVPGERSTIDECVVARVFPLDDDIHGSSHTGVYRGDLTPEK